MDTSCKICTIRLFYRRDKGNRRKILPIYSNKRKFKSFEDFERKLGYWEKEYNNFPMKPLGWKSPNEQLKEYKLKKSA